MKKDEVSNILYHENKHKSQTTLWMAKNYHFMCSYTAQQPHMQINAGRLVGPNAEQVRVLKVIMHTQPNFNTSFTFLFIPDLSLEIQV